MVCGTPGGSHIPGWRARRRKGEGYDTRRADEHSRAGATADRRVMDDAEVAAEVAAIHARLAALARDPGRPGVAEEIGSIRARLRELAETNAEVGDRLSESLGLRQPPDA